MFLGWFLITLTAVLLLYLYWVKSHKDPKALLIFLPASRLLFSFRQYESILWGFTSVEIYLIIFTAVATFTLLEGCPKLTRSFILALVVNHSVEVQIARAPLALFLICLIVPYSGGWQEGANWRSSKEMCAYVLKTYQTQSDENIQTYLYPSAAVVRGRAEFVEQNGLNVFGEPAIVTSSLTSASSDTYFYLDTINGKIVSRTPVIIHSDQERTITITGWAVDREANAPARVVFITIDGTLDLPALYGVDRPDVAAAFSNPHFEYSGYIATFSSFILPKGRHTISLKIVLLNGPYFYYEQNVACSILE